MTIKIVAFGIAKDILNGQEIEMTIGEGTSVADLKAELQKKYPAFEKLAKFSLAVGEAYREDDFVIEANQEVVIIPPVAGG